MSHLTTDKEKEYKPTLIQCPRCTRSGYAIHKDRSHWKCLVCGHTTPYKGANENKMSHWPYDADEWDMISQASYVHFKDPDIGPDQLKDTNGIQEEKESKFTNLTQPIKDWLFKRW